LHQLQAIGFNGLKSMGLVANVITNQAFMIATDDIFWLSGWIFIGLLVIIWFSKPPFTAAKGAVAAE
jgi:DHA2 family multidrug resistance protein